MPHGPVNSITYEYLSGAYDPDNVGWSDFLTDRENHNVGLANRNIAVHDLDELSQAEIVILADVWAQFGSMDKWTLRDWTHVEENVPEWKDPNGSSRSISLHEIMEAVGVDEPEKRARDYQSLLKAQEVLASL